MKTSLFWKSDKNVACQSTKTVSKSVRRYVRRRRLHWWVWLSFSWAQLRWWRTFVVGSCFTLSGVLLPRIRALTETTVTIPDDVGFNRDVSGILAGFDDGVVLPYVLSSEVKLATNSSWWTTDYTKKKQLSWETSARFRWQPNLQLPRKLRWILRGSLMPALSRQAVRTYEWFCCHRFCQHEG